jgi:hypothetical protein
VHKLLDQSLNDLTARHREVYRLYQVARTLVGFGAAGCFVVGSVFFFSAETTTAADWLFLTGSILFAVQPTLDFVRSFHLRRLPVEHASAVNTGR